MQRSDQREAGRLYALSQVGFEMVVPIVGGWFLDDWLGWSPWCVAAGVVLGLTGGLAHLLVMLKRFEQDDSDSKRDGS